MSVTASSESRWSTRAELLAERAAALPGLERRVLSLARLGGQVALFLAAVFLGVLSGSALRQHTTGEVVIAVVSAVLAAAAAVLLVRTGLGTRRAYAGMRRWEELEREGRSLPRGQLAPEHRTPVDAKDDDDFEQVAAQQGAAAALQPVRTGILVRGVVSGLGLGVGLICLLLAALPDDPPHLELRVALAVTGLFATVTAGAMGVAATRHSHRLTRALARLDADVREVRLQRDPDPERDAALAAGSRRRGLQLLALASPLVLLLVAQLAGASPGALVGFAAVLVVAGVVAMGVLASRRGPG